jgi:dienelactone hydrolase
MGFPNARFPPEEDPAVKRTLLPRRGFLQASAAAALTGRLLPAQPPAPREVSWLERIQTPPAALPPDAPKLSPLLGDGAGLLSDGTGHPIVTREAWQTRRAALRRWWLDFLGPMPERPAPPAWKVIEEDRIDGLVRARIEYDVEPGVRTEAYLIRPEQPPRMPDRPGVVVLHSTVNHSILQPAGLGPDPEKAFGLKLARQGMVTLSPRNFLWPTNDRIDAKAETARFHDLHPRTKGMARMLHDAQVALDLLASLPDVDPGRLGCVGHSLGAKEALYLAALDERVRVAVSSEGGIGLRFSNWDAEWYLGAAINDPSFAREHHELLALVAPRAFLLIGGDSADGDRGWPFIEAALPVYRLFDGPARVGQLNHKQGHKVPPEAERAIEEWFAAYL